MRAAESVLSMFTKHFIFWKSGLKCLLFKIIDQTIRSINSKNMFGVGGEGGREGATQSK